MSTRYTVMWSSARACVERTSTSVATCLASSPSFFFSTPSTLIYTTLENEKEREKKKEESEMFVLQQHTLSKQRYLHLTRANTNENSLPCGTYHGLVLFTTVYLSDTISGSDIYKKLETQSSRGRRSNARVTFMRDLTRKNALFPAIDRDK